MTFALVIFLPGLRRRGLRWTFVLIALVPLTILSGCSASRINSEDQSAHMSVLVIQASSGNGSNPIVRSGQVTLRVNR